MPRKPKVPAAPVEPVHEVDAAILAADLAPVEPAPEAAPEPTLTTNTGKMTLHYGDGTGRRLHPGESADVPPGIVAIWRGAGFIQ